MYFIILYTIRIYNNELKYLCYANSKKFKTFLLNISYFISNIYRKYKTIHCF